MHVYACYYHPATILFPPQLKILYETLALLRRLAHCQNIVTHLEVIVLVTFLIQGVWQYFLKCYSSKLYMEVTLHTGTTLHKGGYCVAKLLQTQILGQYFPKPAPS